ncbi:MAG TPA: tail fiber protein [Pyrinomonadaceae bacterium]|nr:tail fiber protein [Pyrinomonadaceae bacterium]
MPPFVGQISLFSFDFPPYGWVFCDGSVLPISENEMLFNRLKNTFGGDGENTFAVPDLRAIAPKNCQYCIALFGDYMPDVYQLLLGQTIIAAFSLNTGGMLECTGQSLSTGQYVALESLMGNRFGGDGKNNFNLPDLRGKAPAHCSYVMDVKGNYPGGRMPDMLLGELLLVPYEAPPIQGLLLCNGQLLQIAQNTALFNLIGNTFGGDGKQTFAVPNLSAVAPSKFNYYIGVQGTLPQRG